MADAQPFVLKPLVLPPLELLVENYGGDVDRAETHLRSLRSIHEYRQKKYQDGLAAADSQILSAKQALSSGTSPDAAARSLAAGLGARAGVEIGDLAFSGWPTRGPDGAGVAVALDTGPGSWTERVQVAITRKLGYPRGEADIVEGNDTRIALTRTLKEGRVEQRVQEELARLREAFPDGGQRAAIDRQIAESATRMKEHRDILAEYGLEAWLDVTGPQGGSVEQPPKPELPDPGTALDWMNPGERYRFGPNAERIKPGMAVFRDDPGVMERREAEFGQWREGLVKLVEMREKEIAEARQRIDECPADAPEVYRTHLAEEAEKATRLLALNQKQLAEFDERAAFRKASVRQIDTPQGRYVSMEA